MITTRARCGNSAIDYLTLSLHIVQQFREVLAGEALRRALEALHRPRPEIEVQRAGRVLDRPPQRPAVLAHQAEDPGPGDLVPQRRPVVAGDQLGQRVQGQPALAPDVAQLETGVVVARVLVVDQPDPLPVVDEVRGEQVVVARDGGGPADRERRAGVGDVPHQVVVAGRMANPCSRATARYRCWMANMSKSPRNPGPACSSRQARAIRPMFAGLITSALPKVRPSM